MAASRFFLCTVLLTAFVAGPAFCEPITVGSPTPEAGSCYPFSCFALDGGTVYQQVYAASAFPGPLKISKISFFWAMDFCSRRMDDAVYSIDFSTTAASVGNLSVALQDNVGADAGAFGTFHISGNMPDALTLAGIPFHYDPANGNLLMQVTVDSAVSRPPSLDAFFQLDDTGNVISRAYINAAGALTDNYALVTEFNVVPEPSTVALLGLGISGLTILRRRRRP